MTELQHIRGETEEGYQARIAAHKKRKVYPSLEKMIALGGSYGAQWRLEDDELDRLAEDADIALSTMNGDTGTIEITVKQFAQLVSDRAGRLHK